MEVNAWYIPHVPTSQHLSPRGETSSNHKLVTRVSGIESGYICCNAGYRANGRGIMTPVDIPEKGISDFIPYLVAGIPGCVACSEVRSVHGWQGVFPVSFGMLNISQF